jgi:DNA-binding IclR family transcriptional regulator
VSTPPTGTQAVDRAAQLLVRIVDSGKPVSFGVLAEGAELPKSTASRLLNALERQGLVDRDRDGAFRPGPVLMRFARRSSPTDDLVEAAEPFLQRLSRRTGETVNLAICGRDAVEQIAQVDSRFLLGATNWVGLDVPFHCSAVGKVFLAHGSVPFPSGPLARRTPRTLTTHKALGADLAQVLRRGYAIMDEELESGLVAVAAPVRGSDGTVIAAISITGATVRISAAQLPDIAAIVAVEAHNLSLALGFHPRKEGAA